METSDLLCWICVNTWWGTVLGPKSSQCKHTKQTAELLQSSSYSVWACHVLQVQGLSVANRNISFALLLSLFSSFSKPGAQHWSWVLQGSALTRSPEQVGSTDVEWLCRESPVRQHSWIRGCSPLSLLRSPRGCLQLPAEGTHTSGTSWKEAPLQHLHPSPFLCFCSPNVSPAPGNCAQHGHKVWDEKCLEGGDKHQCHQYWSIFQLLLSSNNYRAAAWLLMAPGEELHSPHHTPTIFLSLICPNHPEASLFFNSWVIFPKQVKADMALFCVWIVMLHREPKAWYVAFGFFVLVVIWAIIYYCYKWSSKLNLVATTKIMWNTPTH